MAIGPPYKEFVTVHGKEYEIRVYQKSKSVWEAAGTCDGHSIRVTGSSHSAALAHWREAARYQGDVGYPPSGKG